MFVRVFRTGPIHDVADSSLFATANCSSSVQGSVHPVGHESDALCLQGVSTHETRKHLIRRPSHTSRGSFLSRPGQRPVDSLAAHLGPPKPLGPMLDLTAPPVSSTTRSEGRGGTDELSQSTRGRATVGGEDRHARPVASRWERAGRGAPFVDDLCRVPHRGHRRVSASSTRDAATGRALVIREGRDGR